MLIKLQQYGIFLGVCALLALQGFHPAAEHDEATIEPVQVSVLALQQQDLWHTQDLPGRVAAVRSAEIRAQISGIVQRRLFEQGADIAAGTVLYQINAAPFQAEADSAAAALHKAEAVATRADLESKRLAQLSKTGVISRQLYDDAVSLREQAIADVALAKAALSRRQLDLQFARVTAPIAGRIDQSIVSEGALVSPTDASPMARIQQIDQVYVDVRMPAALLPALNQTATPPLKGTVSAAKAQSALAVEILSSSGTPLKMQGRVLFTGSEVDSGTGDVLLRLLVDNPGHRLLPGLYVQARVPVASYQAALFVPQQAVRRINGQPTVWLLDAQSRVQAVPLKIAELIDGQYLVTAGLAAGQQLVVEGIERLSPALEVKARPWQPAEVSLAVDAQQVETSPAITSQVDASQTNSALTHSPEL